MPDTLYKQTGEVIINHGQGEPERETLFETIRASFPWFDSDFHFEAADPHTHEVLNERVIRTCFNAGDAFYMVGHKVASAHGIFCLDSKTSFVMTTELFTGDQPVWKPAGAHVIAVTGHYEEYGKPAPEGFDSFREYFMACRPEVAAEALGLETEGVNEDTLYSVLSDGSAILAARRYTGYKDEGVLSNWQGLYVFFCKRAKRMDLARQLFELNL